jgi:imidazolonepropionase-like amidohydrolase
MLWLVNGHICDVENGRPQRLDLGIDEKTNEGAVAIGRIAALTRKAKPKPGDRVIDVPGLYLLPGLIDCHVHLVLKPEDGIGDMERRTDAGIALYAAKAAQRTLLGGTTTVRDCGGWNYVEMALRHSIESGESIGPRLYLAGRILSMTAPGMFDYPGMYEVADGPEAVKAAARKQLAMGADFVKLMASGAFLAPEREDPRATQYTESEIRAAVDIARTQFKHVAAHAHAADGIRNAVAGGADSIEHGSFADPAALKLMARKGTYLVPTLCSLTSFLRDEAAMASTRPHWRERLVSTGDAFLETMRDAHRHGVPFAMGSDAGTPGNHHGGNADETIDMVEEIGMSPVESLRASTHHPAKLLRQEEHLGTLREGRFADIIACAENPFQDITTLRRLKMVMKGGVVYRGIGLPPSD